MQNLTDFIRNAGRAVKEGNLPADVALRALTSGAAKNGRRRRSPRDHREGQDRQPGRHAGRSLRRQPDSARLRGRPSRGHHTGRAGRTGRRRPRTRRRHAVAAADHGTRHRPGGDASRIGRPVLRLARTHREAEPNQVRRRLTGGRTICQPRTPPRRRIPSSCAGLPRGVRYRPSPSSSSSSRSQPAHRPTHRLQPHRPRARASPCT